MNVTIEACRFGSGLLRGAGERIERSAPSREPGSQP